MVKDTLNTRTHGIELLWFNECFICFLFSILLVGFIFFFSLYLVVVSLFQLLSLSMAMLFVLLFVVVNFLFFLASSLFLSLCFCLSGC